MSAPAPGMPDDERQNAAEGDAKIVVQVSPTFYEVGMTLTQNAMFRVTVALRRLCDEYDAGPECETLLEQCLGVYIGDLPMAPAEPIEAPAP